MWLIDNVDVDNTYLDRYSSGFCVHPKVIDYRDHCLPTDNQH